MAEKTTIEVRRETWRRLNAEKHPGDSFDDVIVELLEGGARKAKQRASSADETEEERIKCEHCGHVWTTRSAAVRPTCSRCSSKTDRLDPEA